MKIIQSFSIKRVNWLILFSSFIYVLLVYVPLPAYACDCIIPPSVETELSQSDAVFSGKVISIKEKRSAGGYINKEIIFEIYQTWKGVDESQVKIITGKGGGDCGFHFVPDGEYLVYGRYSDMYGKSQLSTGICDRTVDLTAAIEDLKLLGNGDIPDKQDNINSNNSSDNMDDIDSNKQNGSIYTITFVVFSIVIVSFFSWWKRKKS